MKRICFLLLAICLLLLCACGQTPALSDETVQTTTTTSVQGEQETTPPAVLLNGTQTVNAGSSQWSRMTEEGLTKKVVSAPHPYKYPSEKHPTLYAKKSGKNTVTVTAETQLSPKQVKVSAFKMSEMTRKEIAVDATATTDAQGKTVYTFELLNDEHYAYTVTLYWDRYDGTDYSTYSFYSKVK